MISHYLNEGVNSVNLTQTHKGYYKIIQFKELVVISVNEKQTKKVLYKHYPTQGVNCY